MMKDMELDEPIPWSEWFLMRKSVPKINSEAKHALFKAFGASKNEEQTR